MLAGSDRSDATFEQAGHDRFECLAARAARSRGPVSHWSRDDVVAAEGVILADTGGLDAVTTRSIGAQVGTAGASLYRLVDSRDHALELLADRVAGEFDYANTPPRSGPGGLLELAVQARAIWARHPWMLAIRT